jgi:hypothetical protein
MTWPATIIIAPWQVYVVLYFSFQSDDKLNQGDNSVDTDIIYKLSYFPYIKKEGLTLSLIFSNLKEIIFSVYQTYKRFTN